MKRLLVRGRLLAALGGLVIGCDDPGPDKLAAHWPQTALLSWSDKPSSTPMDAIISRPSIASIAVRDHVVFLAGMGRVFAARADSLESLVATHTAGSAVDIAVFQDQLFVADGPSGLAQYTLDDAGRPTFSKRAVNRGECHRVVASTRAVAALCKPRKLVLIGSGQDPRTILLPADAADAAFSETALFLTSPGNGLIRVHLDSDKPPVVYDHEKLDRILSVAALGSRLFVGLRDKRILELDPETANVKREVAILNRPLRLIGGKNQLLVASTWLGDTGATWIDTSDDDLRVGGRLPFSVATGALVENNQWIVARPEGSTVLVTTEGKVLTQMDGVLFDRVAMVSEWGLSWAENRTAAWMFDARGSVTFQPWNVADARACGDRLCVLESTGRMCRYQSTDAIPECISVAEGGVALGQQWNRRRFWVSDSTGGLHGASLEPHLGHDVAIPRSVTTAAQNFGRMAIDGDLGAVIDVDMAVLQVVDLGSAPRMRGQFLLHALPTAVAIAGEDVFVAEPRGGIQVVRLSQRDSPQEVAWQVLEGATGIAAKRDESGKVFVFVTERERGLSTWVWRDKNKQLEKLRRVALSGIATDVVVHDSNVFVATGGSIVKLAFSELVQ